MNSEEAVLHSDFTLYAVFLLQHLEEATEACNHLSAEYGLDSHIPAVLPGAKLSQTNEALQSFLQALVEGKAVAYERQQLNEWKSTLTAEQVSVQSIQMLDVLLVKKLLLLHFLPHFTSDPPELASLSVQIEKFHHVLIKQLFEIGTDVPHLKQSETELRHSLSTLKNYNEELQTINQELAERKYFIEQVTHTIPSYIFIFDLLTFTASYFNRDLLEDLGYPLEATKVRGLSMIKKLFYPGDYEKRNHFYGNFSKEDDQEVKELELRILHSDGRYRTFLIRNTVFKRDSEGVPNQVIGVAQDITHLKQIEDDLRKAWFQLNEANEELSRTEETLKELNNELEERIGKSMLELAASNERFELVAQATNDAIWDRIYGEDYIHWNQSFEQIFGYISEEEKNNPSVNSWFERMHPEDREGIRQVLEQSIYLGNTSWGSEYRFLRADGTYAYVLSRAVILYDNDQKPHRLVGSMMDISHLKETELTLQKRNEELIKINADLDNFIYVASHDLKHPVTNLEGLLAMLREHLEPKEDAESEKWLNLMDVSTLRLRKTIQDIAEISKVQKGLEEAYEVLDFEHTLDEIKIDIFNLISQAGAIIYTDFQVKEISYSHKNLRSILYNLLSNALKYRSPDRPIVVQLATYWQEGNIILTVQDNGLGLNPQQQAKLFTMFKRLHTHVEGTGIGLYMIKRIIENNGGKIFVTSESQVGTTFAIQFKPTFAHEKT